MHHWRVTGSVLGLLLCLLSTAAGAAAPRETEPTLAPLTSVRMQSIFYTDLDGPLLVCQRRIESWQRWHDTCHSLAASPYYPDYQTGDVVENVLYDGLFYSRRNAETTWAVTSAEGVHDPTLTLTAGLFGIPFEAAVTDLGSVSIGGIPTTHYQYWSIDKAYNQSLGDVQPVYDHFVAANGLVLQDQASLRGSNTLTRVRGYTQHNTPIAVAAPPANLVEAGKQAIINPR